MSDETSLYPAVTVKIGRHNRRLYHDGDLKTAVRLGDIKDDTRIIYEASLGHRAQMTARDCPILTDLLEEFGRPEEEIPSPEQQPASATTKTKASPWQNPAGSENSQTQPRDYAAQIVTDYNDIKTPADLLDFDESYLPYALSNRASDTAAELHKDKRARFWLIPDDDADHKAYLVPGSDSHINWDGYRTRETSSPFVHHFLLIPGEKLKLVRPATMVKGADGWELLEQGVLEGLAAPETESEPDTPYAQVPQPNDAIIPEMQLPPEKSKTGRNIGIILALLLCVFMINQCMEDGSFSGADNEVAADGRLPNICTNTGQGYVSRPMLRQAERLYIDRDTNIRAGAGVSSRKMGTVKRGQPLELRRASDKSQENWYQIVSGENCGHYVYSYAETPSDEAPPTFITYANVQREIQEDTPLLDRPDGSIIGTVPAGRTVSYVGEVAGGYGEIIDAQQDNVLGYVALSAFEEKTRATADTGLAVHNNCAYPIRIYIRMQARGPAAQGALTLRPGEKRPALTYTDGTKVNPVSAQAQVYAERDDFTMGSAELQAWRPRTQPYTAQIDGNDNYVISPQCQ